MFLCNCKTRKVQNLANNISALIKIIENDLVHDDVSVEQCCGSLKWVLNVFTFHHSMNKKRVRDVH